VCCAGTEVVEVVLAESCCVEVSRQFDEVVPEQICQGEVDRLRAVGNVLRFALEVRDREEDGRSLTGRKCVSELSDGIDHRRIRVGVVVDANGEHNPFDLCWYR